MAMCPECGARYREPEDEQGDHPCPYCGHDPYPEEVDDEDSDDA